MKALDFLLRFTLRFQLAPNRELKYYTRVRDFASRKMQQKQSDRTRSLDLKAWKDKAESLQDELGQLVAKGGSRTDRIAALLEMLGQHARIQPSIGQGGVRKAELGGADPVMEAKMMLEVMEDALDEVDEEAETEENQAQENQAHKDVSGKHIGIIQSPRPVLHDQMLRMLSIPQALVNHGLFDYLQQFL